MTRLINYFITYPDNFIHVVYFITSGRLECHSDAITFYKVVFTMKSLEKPYSHLIYFLSSVLLQEILDIIGLLVVLVIDENHVS